MRVTVISGSPKGELSVSLQYLRYLAKHFPEHAFEVFHVAQAIKSLEKEPDRLEAIVAAMAASDAVFCVFPLYYMLVPGQYLRFFELLGRSGKAGQLAGKPAATLSTSVHFYDHLPHDGLRGTLEDLGMTCVDFYSAEMHDLEKPERRANLLAFAREFFETVESGRPLPRQTAPLPDVPRLDFSGLAAPSPQSGKKAVIVADALAAGDNLAAMVARLAAALGPDTDVVDLGDLDVKGGCLGCCECGPDNRCAYEGKDGVIDVYDRRLGCADIVVFATRLVGRFCSSAMKCFIDRGFFRNHAPFYTGKQFAWLAAGPLRALPHMREMMTVYAEMHKAGLCGLVSDDAGSPEDVALALDALAGRLARRAATGYVPPETFLSLAGRKLLRDEIYGRLRFVFQADHRYFTTHGFYDFPQKDLKMRLVNALAMAATRIPAVREKFRKMIKTKMVEPCQKIVAGKE